MALITMCVTNCILFLVLRKFKQFFYGKANILKKLNYTIGCVICELNIRFNF